MTLPNLSEKTQAKLSTLDAIVGFTIGLGPSAAFWMQGEGMLAAKEASVLLPASTHQFGSVSRRLGPGDWDLLRRHDMLKDNSFSSAGM